MMRPCLRCNELIPTGSRCQACRLPATRRTPQRTLARSATDPLWRRISQRLRAASPFCEQCGRTDTLTVDHIIPVSENPTLAYTEANLRVLCQRCNARRGTTVTPEERTRVTLALDAHRHRAM